MPDLWRSSTPPRSPRRRCPCHHRPPLPHLPRPQCQTFGDHQRRLGALVVAARVTTGLLCLICLARNARPLAIINAASEPSSSLPVSPPASSASSASPAMPDLWRSSTPPRSPRRRCPCHHRPPLPH